MIITAAQKCGSFLDSPNQQIHITILTDYVKNIYNFYTQNRHKR